MAVRLPEGWGQGPDQWGSGPALAINDSNAKFHLTACPIHLHQASPGSKGQGKGRPPKGQGKGVKTSPGERKSPNLKPEEERAEPTTEEVKCPKCPNTYNWTTRAVCRSCGCKLPQGNVSKANPPSEERWPGQCENWWGWIFLWCFLGNLLCFRCQKRNRPGRDSQRRKGHPALQRQHKLWAQCRTVQASSSKTKAGTLKACMQEGLCLRQLGGHFHQELLLGFAPSLLQRRMFLVLVENGSH